MVEYELVKAVLCRIEDELIRHYWNKNQREMDSPFKNTGAIYSNDFFTVRAYNWNDENDWDNENIRPNKPNFDSKLLKCWWYKHSLRGLEYELNFDDSNTEDHLCQLCKFLYDCLDSIERDFT